MTPIAKQPIIVLLACKNPVHIVLQEDVKMAFTRAANDASGGTNLPAVEDLLGSMVVACTTAVAAALEEGGLFSQEDAGGGGPLESAIAVVAGAVKARLASFRVSHDSAG